MKSCGEGTLEQLDWTKDVTEELHWLTAGSALLNHTNQRLYCDWHEDDEHKGKEGQSGKGGREQSSLNLILWWSFLVLVHQINRGRISAAFSVVYWTITMHWTRFSSFLRISTSKGSFRQSTAISAWMGSNYLFLSQTFRYSTWRWSCHQDDRTNWFVRQAAVDLMLMRSTPTGE